MKVLEAAMKATQMPQLGSLGQTAMKAEFPTSNPLRLKFKRGNSEVLCDPRKKLHVHQCSL